MVGSSITGGGDATTSQGGEATVSGQQRQAEGGRQMRAATGGRRGLPRWSMRQEWAAGGRDSAREADMDDGRRDERRWWVADDVTRVANDDGRRTMMSCDERS